MPLLPKDKVGPPLSTIIAGALKFFLIYSKFNEHNMNVTHAIKETCSKSVKIWWKLGSNFIILWYKMQTIQVPTNTFRKVKTLLIKKNTFHHKNTSFVVTTSVMQIAVHKKCQSESIKKEVLVAYRPSMHQSNYPTLLLPKSWHYSELWCLKVKGYSNSLIFKSWYKSFNMGSTHNNGPKEINTLPGNRPLVCPGHSLPLAATFFEPHVFL